MAGEYFRWKYKDVKPDPKPEYTKAQLRKNWWDYHWKFLLLGLAVLVAVFFLVRDIFFTPKADYDVALVTAAPVPDEVVEELEARLTELGEDLNGDGEVMVAVYTYWLGFDEQGMNNIQEASANTTRLTVDLTSGDTYIVLTDDPEGFQRRMGALAYLDGTVPDEKGEDQNSSSRWREMVYSWADCPVLSGLDLGSYVQFLDLTETEMDGQTAMDGIYIGRRVLLSDKDRERFAGADRLWQKLTAGAVSLEG